MQQPAFTSEIALYPTSHIPHRALSESETDATPRINPSHARNSLTKEGSIHDCDEMVVEKTSGKDKMATH
jgi:hypothetical protein